MSLQYIDSSAKSQQFLTVFLTICYGRRMAEAPTYAIDEVEERTGFDRRTIAYYVQMGVLPKVGRRGPKTRYSRLFVDRLRFIRVVRELQDQGTVGTMTLGDFRELFQNVPAETIAEVVAGDGECDGDRGAHATGGPAIASPGDRRRVMMQRIAKLVQATDDRAATAALEAHGRPMDPAQLAAPAIGQAPAFEARIYKTLADGPTPALKRRDPPSGEHHRLTLDALERPPDAPELTRTSGPSLPIDEELREALARLHAVVRRQPRAYLRTTETWTRARITEEIVVSARGLEERHLPLLERVAQILRRLVREGDGGTNW